MAAIDGRVKSTCFEVPPAENDNTPLPNIIITYDGFENVDATKDTVWESDDDSVQVSVDVAASSPNEVKSLIRAVRRAVKTHIVGLYQHGEDTPQFDRLSSNGIAWDWVKPCYYQKLTYQCITQSYTYEQEE